jgi:hypothetical protein
MMTICKPGCVGIPGPERSSAWTAMISSALSAATLAMSFSSLTRYILDGAEEKRWGADSKPRPLLLSLKRLVCEARRWRFRFRCDRRGRMGRQRGWWLRSLKKIPQREEFKDLPSGQNGGDFFGLRSGENLIELQLRHWLQCELPYAFVDSALSNEVGHGATFVIE